MPSAQSNKNATLMGLVAILFWSTLPIVTVYTKGVPPFLSLSIAYAVAFIVYMMYWKYKDGSILKRLKQPLNYIVFSVLGIFCSNATFLLAMQKGNPVVSYVISNIWPIFALFYAAILFKEKLSFMNYLGAALGCMGVVVISLKGGELNLEASEMLGTLLALINAVVWSFFSVATRKFSNVPADSIGLPLGIISVLAYITHSIWEVPTNISTTELLAIIYIGTAPWGAAYAIWGYALRFGDIKSLMLFGYFMPLLGVIWMVAFGYASFTINILISMILIVGGAGLGSIKSLSGK